MRYTFWSYVYRSVDVIYYERIWAVYVYVGVVSIFFEEVWYAVICVLWMCYIYLLWWLFGGLIPSEICVWCTGDPMMLLWSFDDEA